MVAAVSLLNGVPSEIVILDSTGETRRRRVCVAAPPLACVELEEGASAAARLWSVERGVGGDAWDVVTTWTPWPLVPEMRAELRAAPGAAAAGAPLRVFQARLLAAEDGGRVLWSSAFGIQATPDAAWSVRIRAPAIATHPTRLSRAARPSWRRRPTLWRARGRTRPGRRSLRT